jgi:hypothetical protein
MRSILAVLLLACASAALAAPKVAAISLIGDKLLVIGGQMQTGTRIERNMKEYVPVGTSELDTATVLAFEREASLSRPRLEVVLLRASDPSIHAVQDEVVAGKRDPRELLSSIAPLARRAGATHLVLFVKQRGEAKVQVENGSIGTGFIEGLGFYVDRWPRLRRTEVGEVEMGILAPFAYFKAVLVELDGLKVVAEESAHLARAHYPKDVTSRTDPWEYLSVAEKVQALNALSAEALKVIVPKVLARL